MISQWIAGKLSIISDNSICQSAAKPCSKGRFRDYRKGYIGVSILIVWQEKDLTKLKIISIISQNILLTIV